MAKIEFDEDEEQQQLIEEVKKAKKDKKHKKDKKKKHEEEEEEMEEEEKNGKHAAEAEIDGDEEDGEGEGPEDEGEEEEEGFKSKKGGKNGSSSDAKFDMDDPRIEQAIKSLNEVDESLLEQFKSVAQRVIKKNKNDASIPMAAALAVLSGATKRQSKSLLTQKDGYTTYKLTKHDDEIRGKSFAFVIVKRILGEEEGDRAITGLCFSKDKMSLIFDLPSSYDEKIQEQWYNTKSLEMGPITELPEIDESSRGGGGGGGFGGGRGGGGRGGGGFGGRGGGGRGGGGFGGRGGFGGGRGGGGFGGRGGGGFGGRGGGGRGGGFGGGRGGGFGEKRSFGGGDDHANKKIKFDDDE